MRSFFEKLVKFNFGMFPKTIFADEEKLNLDEFENLDKNEQYKKLLETGMFQNKEFESKNFAYFAHVVAEKDDGELGDKCRSYLDDYNNSEKFPPFPTDFEKTRPSNEDYASIYRSLHEPKIPLTEMTIVGKEIEKEDRIAMQKRESYLYKPSSDNQRISDYINREFIVEEILSPVNKSKYSWYPCWKYFWEALRDVEGMRRSYEGSEEQWEKMVRLRQLDLPSKNLQKYKECYRETDAGVNEEFILEFHRRNNLIRRIAKRIASE